jgi:perosamine synthetase
MTAVRRIRQTGRVLPLLHPRHRIDASVADALYALAASGRVRAPATPELGPALVCLSVRSAFDLLLCALDLPPGDEVLVSAVTHPDMVRILELHGLRPVPVDLDPWTLAPEPWSLRAAVTERTRAVLVAHLFGAQEDPYAGELVAQESGGATGYVAPGVEAAEEEESAR